MPAIFVSLAVKVLQMILEKLAPIIIASFKKLMRNIKINSAVNKEVKNVKEALEEIDKTLKETDETKTISPEQELKLREAARRLRDNIFS